MPSFSPTSTTYAQGSQAHLRTDKGKKTCLTVTLDLSKFTEGTHYPSGYLPSGLVLGKVTATGKYGPYDDAAVDGRATATGLLFNSESAAGGASAPIVTAMQTEGDVIEARLPSGHGLDANGKTDLGNRWTWV